jgi:hypothetical protein
MPTIALWFLISFEQASRVPDLQQLYRRLFDVSLIQIVEHKNRAECRCQQHCLPIEWLEETAFNALGGKPCA